MIYINYSFGSLVNRKKATIINSHRLRLNTCLVPRSKYIAKCIIS